MVDESLVASVDAELKTLEAECLRMKENPFLIRVIGQLRRLTAIEIQGEESTTASAAVATSTTETAAPEKAPAKVDPAQCPHKVLTIYGVCLACGKCQHTLVRNGVCSTCGEPVTA